MASLFLFNVLNAKSHISYVIKMSPPIQVLLLFTFSLLAARGGVVVRAIPNPDPAAIQPFHTNPTTPAAATVSTIPAFPEQSDAAGCRLSLPDSFFRGVKSACGGKNLHRGRCCPVLAAWLYAAYSSTALGKSATAGRGRNASAAYDMPVLPDDTETCVGEVDEALRARGVVLRRPNETCDVVYCYCGIRLHSLSCPEAFSATRQGKLVGSRRVKRLERDCLASPNSADGFPGLGGCSKCLHSLRQLNKDKKALDTSKVDERTTKMNKKDCEMMGLTWLLAKNRTAYMSTVSAVIRAMMLSPESDGGGHNHHPRSCALSSDGMPLAVDSAEFSDQSKSSRTLVVPILEMSLSVALACLLYISPIIRSLFRN